MTTPRTHLTTEQMLTALHGLIGGPGEDDGHDCEPDRATYAAQCHGVRSCTLWCACGNDVDTFLTTLDPEDTP